MSTLALLLLTARNASAQMVSESLAPYADRVEASINRGLQWLAEVQTEDGIFPGGYGSTAAVVGFAGMSFLAQGHTPGRGPYGENINRCIDYIMRCQDANGYIPTGGNMYAHNAALLFLSEVSGMVDPERQAKLDTALSKALKVTVAAQSIRKPGAHDGGWRYSPGSGDSDMSLTGWGFMAMRAARLNGARIPDENVERAIKYVLGMQSGSGSFGYQGPGDNINLVGAGALCLELSGYHGSEQMARAAGFIAKNFRTIPASGHWPYALYYNAQAAFQFGGDLWRDFAAWMYETYLPLQQPNGSWNSDSYATTLVLLAFTVPYRQLPIYQRDETVDE